MDRSPARAVHQNGASSVCDQTSGECSSSIACSGHGDCGGGAYCTDDDVCKKADTGTPCDDESDCRGGDDCLGGFCGCDGTAIQAEQVPVNMLMVLDRSNSMQCLVDGTVAADEGYLDPNSRWQAALGAIDTLVSTFDDSIDFGLAVYPGTGLEGPGSKETALCDPDGTPGCDGDLCTIGDRIVEVQPNAGDQIISALEVEEHAPAGCTPSGPSLQAQVGYDELADPGEENFILYITDGAENCSEDPGQVSAIENLRNQEPEVRTFVVGFTEDVNPNELNEAAEAGGMAREDADLSYYQANDEAVLTEALDEIGGLALSCSFSLDEEPPDIDDLFVFLDGESLEEDPDDGWSYEVDGDGENPHSTLNGSACDSLQAGEVEDVNIVQGCSVVIE